MKPLLACFGLWAWPQPIMSKYTKFISAGYKAVQSVFPDIKIIVPVLTGWDNSSFRWNLGGLIVNSVSFDIIIMSLFPSHVAAFWASANQQ
jgi:arabinogalactan endo-1,4-beta-galactosidase